MALMSKAFCRVSEVRKRSRYANGMVQRFAGPIQVQVTDMDERATPLPLSAPGITEAPAPSPVRKVHRVQGPPASPPEIICSDGSGRPQFYDLLRGTRAHSYIAFDIVWLNGVDLRELPLSERRQQLQAMLPKGSAIMSEPVSVIGRGCELFDMMVAHDLEGVVGKRLA